MAWIGSLPVLKLSHNHMNEPGVALVGCPTLALPADEGPGSHDKEREGGLL